MDLHEVKTDPWNASSAVIGVKKKLEMITLTLFIYQ